MTKFILSILILFGLSIISIAVELVKNAKPVAEIVISKTALPSVKTAANELQRHLKKISGAKLPVVNKVSPNIKNQIYVGESSYTRKLGVRLDDVKHDGFKIIADKNYVVLAGKEIDNMTKYLGKLKETRSVPRQRAWEKFSGHRWRRPGFHDFRDINKDCGFDLLDGTGTLYAVYELLEQLGMRWYMPVPDIGIVYPELKTVSIKNQSIKREPEFPQRRYSDGGKGQFKDEFLWFKAMKIGTSFIMPIYHSTARLMEYYREEQPRAYFGKVNGKINYHVPKLTSERLRKDLLKYLESADKVTPEVKYACIGQPDGWSVLGDKDTAAGWDRTAKRGRSGSYSDYSWDFIIDIRKRYMKKYPNKKFTVFAYDKTLRAPTIINKIPENVAIVFCQHSNGWMTHKNELKYREEWLNKMPRPKQQLLIWEYYHQHTARYELPTVPMITTKYLKQNFKGLYDKSAGFLVEVGWTVGKERVRTKLVTPRVGLTHLQLYLHARLCWDRNLDIQAVVNEYCKLFFGPAQAEMKEFYKFAEEVWNRPESRRISSNSGFLKINDVDKYFDILNRAKKKAGATIYGKRIDYITAEMEPLKKLHAKLKRTGPTVHGFKAKHPLKIDGNLDKPFWRARDWTFTPLRDMITGTLPKHVKTNVSFRWAMDNSGLVIGIECFEPKMNKLRANCKTNDSSAIFSDDFVEIKIVTQGGICPKIAINSNGTVLDSCQTKRDTDVPIAYKIKDVVVKKYSDRWTIELKIDAKLISGTRPTNNSPWGINICRQRLVGNTPEHYMLSPSGTNFNDFKCMGNLFIRR